jgi:UDP-N-acetyl-D-glucosamine dehydrogenase
MLSSRISEVNDVRVAIIGIGYVGLPLAVKLAEKGYSVTGVDINQNVIDELEAGRTTVEGITGERVSRVVNETKKLSFIKVEEEPTANDEKTLESLMGQDVIVSCVPTPLHRKRGWHPETSLISKAAQLICRVCETEEKNGMLPDERLLVLESTTYPGTTRKFFLPLRKRFDNQNKKLFLAYSPERTSPGKNSHDDDSKESTFNIERIVAGIDEESTKIAEEFYRTVFREVYPVANLETAEMTKLVENTFRFVSIGFANEMARIAKVFDLNIWEIMSAVKTKPFGLDICYPGLVGGHCLPIDPHYLGWAYRNHRNVATFVEIAEKSHQDARRETIELIQRLLSQNDKGFPKSSILFFGIAYKKNVGDIRESGALDLMKKLFSYGAQVSFWDPVFARLGVKQKVKLSFSETEFNQLPKSVGEKLTPGEDNYILKPRELTGDWENLKTTILGSEFDCIVLATDHDDFHSAYFELLSSEKAPPVIDINNTIESWLENAVKDSEEKRQLKAKLSERSRYMLFGRD